MQKLIFLRKLITCSVENRYSFSQMTLCHLLLHGKQGLTCSKLKLAGAKATSSTYYRNISSS